MTQPTCVCFSGVPGSSKTPIANYLGMIFGFPRFENDAIRSEVKEDLLKDINDFDAKKEFETRLEFRLKNIISLKKDFIMDASIDRKWENLKKYLQDNGYVYFLIDITLSKEKLINLYKIKGYSESLSFLDTSIQEHEIFLSKFKPDIGVQITDATFSDRLQISRKFLQDFLLIQK